LFIPFTQQADKVFMIR